MQKITFDKEYIQEKDELLVRNQKEDLIKQIVDATTEKDKKKLAKMLALAYNAKKWSLTDLHILYQKRNDPGVHNYTGLVWWSVKIKK